MAWRLYSSPRSVTKYKNYFNMAMIAIHWWILLSFAAPWTTIFGVWFGGAYLFGNFALSHSRLPVAKKQTHWVEYAFRHTANIKSSFWVDWWTGYLNFEVVHHLFPTLPPFRSYLLRDKVMPPSMTFPTMSFLIWRRGFKILEIWIM